MCMCVCVCDEVLTYLQPVREVCEMKRVRELI
jgi:hypothetical protein